MHILMFQHADTNIGPGEQYCLHEDCWEGNNVLFNPHLATYGWVLSLEPRDRETTQPTLGLLFSLGISE